MTTTNHQESCGNCHQSPCVCTTTLDEPIEWRNPGGIHNRLAVDQLDGGVNVINQYAADEADLIAALQANPELRRRVLEQMKQPEESGATESPLSRHLVAAHEVVLRLQQNPRIQIEQIDAKDIIADALASAERGIITSLQSSATQGRVMSTSGPVADDVVGVAPSLGDSGQLQDAELSTHERALIRRHRSQRSALDAYCRARGLRGIGNPESGGSDERANVSRKTVLQDGHLSRISRQAIDDRNRKTVSVLPMPQLLPMAPQQPTAWAQVNPELQEQLEEVNKQNSISCDALDLAQLENEALRAELNDWREWGMKLCKPPITCDADMREQLGDAAASRDFYMERLGVAQQKRFRANEGFDKLQKLINETIEFCKEQPNASAETVSQRLVATVTAMCAPAPESVAPSLEDWKWCPDCEGTEKHGDAKRCTHPWHSFDPAELTEEAAPPDLTAGNAATVLAQTDETIVDDLMAKRAVGLKETRMGSVEAFRAELVAALRGVVRLQVSQPEGPTVHGPASFALSSLADRLEQGGKRS